MRVDESLVSSRRSREVTQARTMVLLELTDELRDRLDALSPHLPLELRQRVAAHLVPSHDDHDDHHQPTRLGETGRSQPAETVPHPLLVDVSIWAKSHGTPEQRGELSSRRLIESNIPCSCIDHAVQITTDSPISSA